MDIQKVLIADDEKHIREILKMYCEKEGFDVIEAADGAEAILKVQSEKPDILILDIMMPKLDGLSVLRKMRNKNENTPVLLLTAKDSVEDRVKGLDAGANDYLVKPFAFEELLARVRVLVRKTAAVQKTCYEVGGLEVHVDTHQVLRNGKEIALSSKEFALLRYMVQNEGIVLSREKLEQHLWNYDYMGSSNVVDVYIRYLRKKIDEGFEPKLIHTVRGAGYVLRVNG